MKSLLLLLLLLFTFTGGLSAQSEYDLQRKQFLELDNLIKFIQRLKDAGFSEEEIQKLNLKDEQKQINVMAYIEEIRNKKKVKDKKLKAFLDQNFLTVKDVFNELATMESDTLAKFRDELVGE